MTSEDTESASVVAARRWRNELLRYFTLFAKAFDELHSAVVQQINEPKQHIRAHHDYPQISWLDSGFPSFNEYGFFGDNAPRNYVSTVRPRGLLGILGGLDLPKLSFPRGEELASFLRGSEIGKRLSLQPLWDHPVDEFVGDAVERYFHLYGIRSPIDAKRRDAIVRPMVFGTILRELDLRLVVPITMTHFEVDHFPLTDTSYIVRIPKRLQLARARMSTLGSGAVRMVVGAATHAFVSNGWKIAADDINHVRRSLGQASSNELGAIATFFGALRVATGVSTGYAQVLWMPKRWALDYFCELTPIYGVTLRRYPSEYDNYGWAAGGDKVPAESLKEVRRIYQAAAASQSEAVRLALSRLNGCLTRADGADAILDGSIGLELLLGDDQNQSLSYKLRLRAAALALLRDDPAYPASEVAAKVKRLYEARSAIVHGRKRKSSKRASEPSDISYAKERAVASELLRFVLDALLTHPEYLDPAKIDDELLLRSRKIDVIQRRVAARPKRSRKPN